jgi:hypothetical protein
VKTPRFLWYCSGTFLLGLAFLFTVAVLMRDTGPRPAPWDRRGEATEPRESGDPAPATGDSAEERPETPVEEEEAWRRRTAPGFSGLVIDEAGAPVEGAVVVAYEGPHPSVTRWRPPEVLARDLSDAGGRFRLVLRRTSDAVVLRAAKGAAAAVRSAVDGRHVGMLRAGTIRLRGGLRLSGRVLDEAGGPVARALVVAGSTLRRAAFGGESDVEGRFAFTVAPEARPRLGVVATGYTWQAVPVPEGPPGERDVGDIVLRRGATLRVRVQHGGTPWPGPLELLAYPPPGWFRARVPVPESGAVEIPIPWPGPTNVHLVGPGELDLASAKNVDPDDGVVELAVPETTLVEGLAVDAVTEEPVEVLEAGIVWGGLSFEMGQDGPLTVAQRTRLFPQSGRIGTFRLPKLDFRRAPLVLKTRTHGTHITDEMVDLEAKPLRITLPRPTSIDLEVVGAAEGIAVLWQGHQASGVVATAPVRDGRAVLGDVPPGSWYAVEVIPAALDRARIRVGPYEVPRDGLELRVEIRAAGALRGRLLDPDGNPVPWAELEAQLGTMRVPLLTDAEGRFRAERLSPYRWGLSAPLAYAPVEIRPEETTEVELRQKRPEPVVRLTIEGRVKARGILPSFLRAWVEHRTSEQRVSFGGTFTLELHGGKPEATVHVGTQRNRPLASVDVVVPESGKAVVEIEVVACTLKGRIVDATGAPRKGAMLTGRLVPGEGGLEQHLWVRTGGDGRFVLPGVGRGTVELAVYRAEQIGKGALLGDAGDPVARISRETAEGVLDLGDVEAR